MPDCFAHMSGNQGLIYLCSLLPKALTLTSNRNCISPSPFELWTPVILLLIPNICVENTYPDCSPSLCCSSVGPPVNCSPSPYLFHHSPHLPVYLLTYYHSTAPA
ncbi:hypothetical protein ILYODFUR_030910 [Ilyodon furcidens]|uniref:Uncharacterized protein n=1 Tax=Ilyodon furcidens TaxID=33524 RepID=A0ABV0V7J9_9TELE